MRVRKAILVISGVVGTIACSAAQAQTSPPATQFTVGAKIWHASWLSYIPAAYSGINSSGAPAIGDSVNATEAKEHTDLVPHILVRHNKFFASASHGRFTGDFHVLSSPVILPSGQTLITSRHDHFKRRESDVNLGYYVTPEIGIAIGYKDATETRDTSLGVAPEPTRLLKTTAKGFLLGAVGSFPVRDKLRLYVQAGYGPARLKLKFTDPAMGSAKTNGRYLIGEIGLSYPVYTTASGYGGATAAIGYRSQTIKTDSYASIFQESRDLRDVRDGLVLTLNVTL